MFSAQTTTVIFHCLLKIGSTTRLKPKTTMDYGIRCGISFLQGFLLEGNKVGEIFRFGHSEHFRSCVSLGIDSCHWKNDRKHVLGSLTRFWKGCEANTDDQIETIYSKISSLWKIQIRIGVGYPSNFRFSQKEFIFGRTIPNRGYPENLSKKYSRRKS